MTNIKTINQNVAVIINLSITGLFSVVMTDIKNTNNFSNKEGIGLFLRYMVLIIP
ncbi:hypothetical protein DAPPUDRAFT_314900 [Daphnia pulex]|uniref:Uncharacterized protein n=1 Tax=Daphnia pulex TaxID=6669 RepID=E9G7W0_DAPPU|nr:hypothetical protein DAPPUDRAFT_314900 [Daphnia pulex]|eukprot:EFX84551.1 hypothetical protein DAPPUDRAFT_314900 [Daphnia pulex]